eukprot:s2393_g5.t1
MSSFVESFFSRSRGSRDLTSQGGASSSSSAPQKPDEEMASAAQQAAMEALDGLGRRKPSVLCHSVRATSDESDDYDEQLQEDVFLGKALFQEILQLTNAEMLLCQIKNTFYNLPVMSSMTSEDDTENPWQSAPTVMCVTAWRTKWPNMEAAHNRGECKPCAYFLYKPDGCRNSDDCPYCHLCRKGEIKRRKRKKIKELKAIVLSHTKLVVHFLLHQTR